MLFFYGDSHTNSNFRNLAIQNRNYYRNSVTMHRIGRDGIIINFLPSEHTMNSILVFDYGEVDCRCHIERQINLGRNEDTIIDELVSQYFATISKNVQKCKCVIVVAIIPPSVKKEYEDVHGPITHEFPFLGTDEERCRFTLKMNQKIKEECFKYNYLYFDPFDFYKNSIGCLKYELSDTCGHIKDNAHILESFAQLLDKHAIKI